MMHLIMVVGAIAIAWAIRSLGICHLGATHQTRWQAALGLFLVPPLLLLMTALAILVMGPQGTHMPAWEGWLSHGIAVIFLSGALLLLLYLFAQGRTSVQRVRSYIQQTTGVYPFRILPTPLLFSAQVGFWSPELVVSQGLLDTFDPDHLEAVLIHERGHQHYQDTFWFFWLGWLRRLTCWLPYTEALWQELLLLREIRADQWAARRVDPLLLAESLLWTVQAPVLQLEDFCAAFSATGDRLEERIDDLLGEADLIRPARWTYLWLVLALLPLLSIPFHS